MEHARSDREGWQEVSLRVLACGWVLGLCVGAAMWLGGSGAGMALLTGGALCLTLSMLSCGARKTLLRGVAAKLVATAVWALSQSIPSFF
jgi:hypothetical protein